MKLSYRGQAYDISLSSQFDKASNSPESPKVKLIYRGQTYYATPRPTAPQAASSGDPIVTLIYRGVTYQRRLCNSQLQNPGDSGRAINWRYRSC
jgi:hypothetical protein